MLPPAQRRGFTLIEVLTVIAIIAVLMALLIPTVEMAKRQGERTAAKHDVTQLVTAVKAFYNDYGVYPTDPSLAGHPGVDVEYGNPGEAHPIADVVNILRPDLSNTPLSTGATPFSINTRQTSYLEVPLAQSPTQPRHGLASAAGGTTPNGNSIKMGDWVDYWGNEYICNIDADYDGYVHTYFLTYSDLPTDGPGGGAGLQFGCIAASLGPDGKLGANGNGVYKGSDDVISWY